MILNFKYHGATRNPSPFSLRRKVSPQLYKILFLFWEMYVQSHDDKPRNLTARCDVASHICNEFMRRLTCMHPFPLLQAHASTWSKQSDFRARNINLTWLSIYSLNSTAAGDMLPLMFEEQRNLVLTRVSFINMHHCSCDQPWDRWDFEYFQSSSIKWNFNLNRNHSLYSWIWDLWLHILQK